MRLPIRLFVILYALSLAVVAWGESGSVSKTSGTKNSTSVTIAKPGASSGASASKTKSQPPEAKQGKQAARKPVGKPASQKASPAPAKGQPAAKQAQKPAPKPEVQKPPTQPVKVSVTESVTPAVAPPTPPTPTEARISMSFDKADVNSVIKFLSVAGGVPIVQDPELKGSVTIVSLKDIPLSDAYEVVNAALRVRGYTMVGTLQDKVIRVVSLKKAIADRSGVQSGKEPSAMPSGDNFITQVIPLDYVSASKLKDEMKPLVADDQASIVAITATNTLIVTDIAGNVRRIQQIVKELDKKDIFDIVDVNIYPCKHSSADALVETLNKIFQISKPQAQPQQGRSQDGQPQPAVKSDEGLVTLKGEIRIASDVRTNSLIISAAKPKLELVMKVIEELDIETQAEVKSRVFALNNADAKLVAEQLNKIFESISHNLGFGVLEIQSFEINIQPLIRSLLQLFHHISHLLITGFGSKRNGTGQCLDNGHHVLVPAEVFIFDVLDFTQSLFTEHQRLVFGGFEIAGIMKHILQFFNGLIELLIGESRGKENEICQSFKILTYDVHHVI